MATRTSIRAAALAGLIVVSWFSLPESSVAGDAPASPPPMQAIQITASDLGSHAVALGISKSLVIDFPSDIKDVLVADPKIANAVNRSSRRAFIIAIAAGATDIFFFDANDKQMAGFDIAVARDVNAIRMAIKRHIPSSDVNG
jgi:pilus assembly protein CpaC